MNVHGRIHRFTAHRLWCSVVLGVTVSCVRYRPAPLAPEATASVLEARRLDSPGLRDFLRANQAGLPDGWPVLVWNLSTLTLAAFYYSPDLDVARARWGVARAGVISAGGRPNPGLSVSPTYNASATQSHSPWLLGINLDLPLETFGKRGHRIAQARSVSEGARFNIAVEAWSVRSQLRASSLDLWAAESRLGLLRTEQAAQEELVGLLERRLAAGAASQLDVTRERVALQRIGLSLRESERQEAVARAKVASVVGVPLEALDDVRISLEAFQGTVLGDSEMIGLRREALLGRADIHAALAEYAAADAGFHLEIARQYPDLRLGPGYEWDQGQNKYTLALSLLLPIFNRNRGPIAEAEARRSETGKQFLALQSRVIGDLDQAFAAYRVARRSVAGADSLLANQISASQRVRRAFEIGEVDRVALVASRLELALAQLAVLDARLQLNVGLGLLEDALQRPVFEPTNWSPALQERDPVRGEELAH